MFDPDNAGMGTVKTLTLRPRASSVAQEARVPLPEVFTPAEETLPTPKPETADRPILTPRRSTQATLTVRETLSPAAMDDGESYDTDEEDEFFDAIEANAIPNLEVPAPLKSPSHDETDLPPGYDYKPYEGYRHLRHELPLSADDRPSVSLWSVLKNSIGKDLTKISFPVSFNEPTSMLQRMAEDMEFSECCEWRMNLHLRAKADHLPSGRRSEGPGRSAEDSVRRSVRHVELLVDDRAYREAVQPHAERDVRVRELRQGVPLRVRAGQPPPADLGLLGGVSALALLWGGTRDEDRIVKGDVIDVLLFA